MSESDGSVIGVTKLVDNGPDRDRWNLVVLGDGYRDVELDKYYEDVETVWGAIQSTAPFDELSEAINLHRVDVASAESGAKDPATGDDPRTYFDATFGAIWNGTPLDRLLIVSDGLAVITAQDNVPASHQILVIVNSDKWGGSGGPDVAVCSMEKNASMIAIHEIGHSAFKFADEYDYGGGTYASGAEPCEENVTRSSTASGKWAAMIAPGTELPTPINSGAAVGTYEGAKYSKRGIYRPSLRCYMNDFDPFCSVCADQIHEILGCFLPPGSSTTRKPGVHPMKWTLDDTAEQIQPLTAVTLLGYLREAGAPNKYDLITDPWGNEAVTIEASDILEQIPGSHRPDGRSVIWVKRGAEIVQHKYWVAADFAEQEAREAGGGSGPAAGPAPPPGKKPPG